MTAGNASLIAEARNRAHEWITISNAPSDVRLIDRLADALERLRSWEGLMELLDEHWPDDLIPTLPDDNKRDPGPRIVSLIRWVDRVRADQIRRDAELLDEYWDACGELIDSNNGARLAFEAAADRLRAQGGGE